MGEALSSALDLHQLLRVIVNMGIELTGATSATLSLIEDNKVSIQVHGSAAEKDDSIICSPSGETAFSSAISSCELTGPNNAVSYLGIPIGVKETLVASLNIYSTDSRRDFSLDKIDLLDSFAKQAGLAIENARNYEKEQKRARDASMLYEAVRAIGQTLDPNDLVRVIIAKLSQIAHVDRCLIFLYDKERNRFFFASASDGVTEKQTNFLRKFFISPEDFDNDMWQVLSYGSPFVFSSNLRISTVLRHFIRVFPTSAKAMLVPLIARENIMGLVYLYDSQLPGKFSQYQIELIKTISMQISIALQKLMLLRQQEEQAHQLRALLNISSVLPTTRSIAKVVRLVADKASTLINVASSTMLLFDENTNELIMYADDKIPLGLANEKLQKRIALEAIESKKSYLSLETMRVTDEELKEALLHHTAHVIAIPLIVKKRIIGVLNLFSTPEQSFRKEQIKILISFADQAALAIKNASHETFVKNKLKELAVLFEAGKEMNSSLDFAMVLDIISSSIIKYLESDAISIMLLDEKNHALGFDRGLTVSRSIGLESKFTKKIFRLHDRFVEDVVIGGRAISKTTVNVPDGKYPDILHDMGLRSFLSVPMDYRGKIIGIINVYRKEPIDYTESEISLLSVLANMAATSIENAKLFEQQSLVAGILQSIVMPQKEFTFKGMDFGYKYIPSGDISGDYFDVIPLSETKFGIVIADVSGKGHSAAIYTVRVKYLLKAYALAGYQPREILSMVNNIIIPETADDKFISLFYVEVDTQRKILKYANAGHENPIFYSLENDEIHTLDAEGVLIGIKYDAVFRQEEIPYGEGDLLVLYTDGITEAYCSSEGFFGVEGVIDIVKRNSSSSAQSLANKIYTSVHRFTKRSFADDFSLIVTKL